MLGAVLGVLHAAVAGCGQGIPHNSWGDELFLWLGGGPWQQGFMGRVLYHTGRSCKSGTYPASKDVALHVWR